MRRGVNANRALSQTRDASVLLRRLTLFRYAALSFSAAQKISQAFAGASKLWLGYW
jgi:hypothetical protein